MVVRELEACEGIDPIDFSPIAFSFRLFLLRSFFCNISPQYLVRVGLSHAKFHHAVRERLLPPKGVIPTSRYPSQFCRCTLYAIFFCFLPFFSSFFITAMDGSVIDTSALEAFVCVIAGTVGGLIIGLVTEFYTSHSYSPVQEVGCPVYSARLGNAFSRGKPPRCCEHKKSGQTHGMVSLVKPSLLLFQVVLLLLIMS